MSRNTRSRTLALGNQTSERGETSRGRRSLSPPPRTATPSPEPEQVQHQDPPPPPPLVNPAASLWPSSYQPGSGQYQQRTVVYPPPVTQAPQQAIPQYGFQQPQYPPQYPQQYPGYPPDQTEHQAPYYYHQQQQVPLGYSPVYQPFRPPVQQQQQIPYGYPPVYPPVRPVVESAPPVDWHTRLRRNRMQDFYGNVEHAKAEEWIRSFEKSCRNIGVPETEMAQLAVGFLLRSAEAWIDAVQSSSGKVTDWAAFKAMFYNEYFPATVQAEKASQFLKLEQGNHMTVSQYTNRFNELGRFYPELMQVEERKMARYKDGLAYGIQSGMLGFTARNMAELLNKALEVETFRKRATVVVGNKRNFETSQGSGRGAPQQQFRRLPAQSAVRPPVGAPPAVRPPVGAPPAARPPTTSGCFFCGEQGHFSRNCPRKVASAQAGQPSRAGPSKQVQMFAVDAREVEPEDDVITGGQDNEYYEEYVPEEDL